MIFMEWWHWKDFTEIKKTTSFSPVLENPKFDILLQKDDQNYEKPIAYMRQSFLDDEFKYTLIEKHTYTLVKVIEKFHHFIFGKRTQVKLPLSILSSTILCN